MINQGFEDGVDASLEPIGWNRLGRFRVVDTDGFTGSFTIAPRSGALQGVATTDSNAADTNIGDVEAVTGVDLSAFGYSGGSMAYQDFNLPGPDSLTFFWHFATRQAQSDPEDTAFVSLWNLDTGFRFVTFLASSGQASLLTEGAVRHSGPQDLTFPFGSGGNFRVGFGVLNRGGLNGPGESRLYVDAVPSDVADAVPAPPSAVLAAVGGIVLLVRRVSRRCAAA
jgi:hypothetical protein